MKVVVSDTFAYPRNFAVGSDELKIKLTLQYKVASGSTWVNAGSTQTRTLTPTILQYATRYTINESYEVTLTTGSGNDIADNTDLDFRVKVERVGSQSAFADYNNGGANDTTGTEILLEVSENASGVAATGGNADTLDNIDSTGFLRLGTSSNNINNTAYGNLTITGNLTVQGTQTTLDTATLQVQDKNIVLNYGTGDTSGSANGAGITIQDGVDASNDASILWRTGADYFDFSHALGRSLTPSNATGLYVSANNVNATVLRVFQSSSEDQLADKSQYGFSLNYRGDLTQNDNKLVLLADNQQNANQNTVFEVLQDGKMTIAQDATFSGDILLSSASSPSITITDTTNTTSLLMYAQNANAIVGTYTNHPLQLFSNSALALTLDTSQNATFAGNITSGSVNITTAAVPLSFTESGHSGNGQYWRMPLDGGNLRFDVSLTGGASFTTYDNILQLNSDGTIDVQGAQVFTASGNISMNTKEISAQKLQTGNVTRIDQNGNMFPTSIQMPSGTVVIDASRNVSNVGTISSGAITTSGTINIDSAGHGYLIIDNGGSYESGIIFRRNGASEWETYISASNEDFRFYSYGASGTQLTIRDGVNGNGGTLLSGLKITNGSAYYGHYGALLLNSSQNYTSTSRGWMITNAYESNKFALLYSASATTLPALTTGGGKASGTSVALEINNSGNATFSANIGAASGHVSGKFAVKSTSVHASYDLYNNGTTYLNGAAIIDDALNLTGSNAKLQLGSTTVIDSSRNLTNIGTISSGKVYAPSLISEGAHSSYGVLRITHPEGAEHYTRVSSQTGAIKITLPVSWTSTMLRMTIQVYEYATDESFTVYCGGYNYMSSSTWVNTFAQIISSGNKNRDFKVRFAHDGTKCCIFIGELNTTWSYPQVAVTDFQAGFNNATTALWGSGWDVGYETSSFGTVSVTESNTDIGVHHSSVSVGGTEVISSARNLTNIGSITSSGTINHTGTINATQNINATGYLQAYSYLYTRSDLRVLNAAGTGWTTWGSRSNGNYNLNVGTIAASGISTFQRDVRSAGMKCVPQAGTTKRLILITMILL